MKNKLIAFLFCIGSIHGFAAQEQTKRSVDKPISYATNHFQLLLSPNGQVERFTDLRNGTNYADTEDSDFCRLRLRKETPGIAPDRMERKGDKLIFSFPGTSVTATLRVKASESYLIFDLVEIGGGDFYAFQFARVPLVIDYATDDFAACAMSRRLNTRTLDFSGRSNLLGGECFREIGYEKAGVFLLGMPEKQLRDAMKRVVDGYEPGQMPVSRAGGPYAMDHPKNRGSYIINSEPITKDQVGLWAARLESLGIDQIDFHQGYPFRQGDFVFNEKAYPNGISDFRQVSEEFARHGIITGLHTYSELVSSRSKYVTPVPHKDLDIIASFTLAEDLSETAETIRVEEPTADVASEMGFLLFRSSQIIRIDDEIIVFEKPMREAPWGFETCRRGAYGTKVSAHAKGAPVEQLNQVYGYFVAKKGSDLFFEIARETARTYNEGGFSMIYLDALDGTSGIVEDQEIRWYYEALFVNEILKYTKTPPLMEYSAFSPAIWSGRSRMGALDAPRRGYDLFFDRHVDYNREIADRLYLPAQIGWLMLCPSSGDDNFQFHVFFRENAEYLGAQILAYDYGLSFLDILHPNARLAGDILKDYDSLRRAGHFSKGTLELLRNRDARFLLKNDGDEWFLSKANYTRTVLSPDQKEFTCRNPYHRQTPMIRIENRHTPAAYDSPEGTDLLPFDESNPVSGSIVREFEQPIDLSQRRGLGIWIHGDGGGQLVSIRVESPRHLVPAFTDHIVKADFTGWRYFALAEADNGTLKEWPRDRESRLLEEFRETVHYGSISKVELRIDGDLTGLRFRSLRALPLIETPLINPVIATQDGKSISFRGSIENGCYMEYTPGGRAVVRDAEGNETGEMTIGTPSFELSEGETALSFSHDGAEERRVRITLRTNDSERLK